MPATVLSRICLPSVVTSNNVNINHLKTKHKLFHLKTQFVPRSKHFSSRLKNKSIYVIYGSGFQTGERVPPGVREDLLGGT
jgi:hypothetical protein